MESPEEEEIVETHPSLPPNYVSLVQLQQQWLQKQKEKQLVEEQKENQSQRPKLLEKEGKLIIASQSQRPGKEKKKFCEKEQGGERNERRRAEVQQKIYVSKHVFDGNRSETGGAEGHSKSEEINVGAPAEHGADGARGIDEKVSGGRTKKKKWKRAGRVNRSLAGVKENPETSLGDSSITGGEEKPRVDSGTNGNRDRGVEEKVSVDMVGVVPENKGAEMTLLGDKGFREQRWGNSNNCRLGNRAGVSPLESLPENDPEEQVPTAGDGVHQGISEAGSVYTAEKLPKINGEKDRSVNVGRKKDKGRFERRYQRNYDKPRKWGDSMDSKMEVGDKVSREEDCGNSNDQKLGTWASVSTMESSAKNGSEKEAPKTGNGVDQGMLEAESVQMAEVKPKINAEEDGSVNVGRKRGEGRFRGRYQSNADNPKKCRDSVDSEMELGYHKCVGEEKVILKGNERDGLQKQRTAKGIQDSGDEKIVSGNLSRKIRSDLRFLSLEESSKGNGTLRKWWHGSQNRRSERPKSVTGSVWVKKGENSDTSKAEI